MITVKCDSLFYNLDSHDNHPRSELNFNYNHKHVLHMYVKKIWKKHGIKYCFICIKTITMKNEGKT
jgi:hypothetical protein